MKCAVALLYCHLRTVWLCQIFPLDLINGTVFGGEKINDNEKGVLIFSKTFLNFSFKETFGETVSYMYPGRNVKTRYSLQSLVKIKL